MTGRYPNFGRHHSRPRSASDTLSGSSRSHKSPSAGFDGTVFPRLIEKVPPPTGGVWWAFDNPACVATAAFKAA